MSDFQGDVQSLVDHISSRIDEGSDETFKSWAQYGVTKEQYLAVLPWLFIDTFYDDEHFAGRVKKGIGLVVPHKYVDDCTQWKKVFTQTGAAEIHRIYYSRDNLGGVYLIDLDDGEEQNHRLWDNSNPRYEVREVVRGKN